MTSKAKAPRISNFTENEATAATLIFEQRSIFKNN